jgi:hypothetical protein
VEVPALAREIRHIGAIDPEFAAKIYENVFGYSVSSQQETKMSDSNILPMTSNASQDYEMAPYSLAEHFPSFLEKNVSVATAAVIAVMEGKD